MQYSCLNNVFLYTIFVFKYVSDVVTTTCKYVVFNIKIKYNYFSYVIINMKQLK